MYIRNGISLELITSCRPNIANLLEIDSAIPGKVKIVSMGNNQAESTNVMVTPNPETMVIFLDGMNQISNAEIKGNMIQIMAEVI